MDNWTLPVTGERATPAPKDPKETPTRTRPEDAAIIGSGGMGMVDVGAGGPESVTE